MGGSHYKTVPVYGPNPNAGQTMYNPTALNANQPGNKKPAGYLPTYTGQATPDLFKPYDKFMPTEYKQSRPVYNPTAILQAYMQNMPEFLNAARSQYQYRTPELVQTGQKKVKTSSGLFSADTLKDPKALGAIALAPLTGGLSLAAYGGYKGSKDGL